MVSGKNCCTGANCCRYNISYKKVTTDKNNSKIPILVWIPDLSKCPQAFDSFSWFLLVSYMWHCAAPNIVRPSRNKDFPHHSIAETYNLQCTIQRDSLKHKIKYNGIPFTTVFRKAKNVDRLKQFRLETLKSRRIELDLTSLYELRYGFCNFGVPNFIVFSSKKFNIRGNGLKIDIEHFTCDIRRHLSFDRTAEIWNELPPSVVTSSTWEILKNIQIKWNIYDYSKIFETFFLVPFWLTLWFVFFPSFVFLLYSLYLCYEVLSFARNEWKKKKSI